VKLIFVVVLALTMAMSLLGIAGAQVPPQALDLTFGVTTDDVGRYQMSAFLSGGLTEMVGYKIGGWLVAGSGDTETFLADAYLDYKRGNFYLAGGQKFVAFGPAGGLLVSPGIRGGEARWELPRTTFQVITGRTEFTPVTGGGPRWTPSPVFPPGAVQANEEMTAARVQFDLSSPGRLLPLQVGVNGLRTLGETGFSGDAKIGLSRGLNLYGESAHFDGVHAWVVGVAFTELGRVFGTTRPTSGVLFYQDTPSDYAPAVVGATAYFPAQQGFAGGIYHELSPGRTGIGVFADSRDASLTLFRHIPLT
jgi:hypothetical protein